MEIDKDRLLWIYTRMLRIRAFEDRVHEEYAKMRIPGFVHLYAGEEAVAVGVCAHLTDRDFITSTHRGHGHCIAKGVDLKAMMAEVFGKATGACKGKGGSMHIADVTVGMLGANGIVGGGLPMACGAALTAKTKGTDQVAVCFFGDGASNQGTFHESLNLASIWHLPVVFVAENNLYAESTPARYHQRVDRIAERAPAYRIPGQTVDGMDVFAVYEAAGAAVARARTAGGPTLLECQTYRYYGHFEGDTMRYRTKEEVDGYRARDPIAQFRRRVLEAGMLPEGDLRAAEAQVEAEIAEAVRFAESSPPPRPEETKDDVYVSYAGSLR
jgi:pyruvate dehydrogenase E1 component alpha subunit